MSAAAPDPHRERVLRDLALAARRYRATAGSPASIRAMALDGLERAEAAAREIGLLPTEAEIVAERQDWARELLARSWRKLLRRQAMPGAGDLDGTERVVAAVTDAAAIAGEWGLDAGAVIAEVEAEPEVTW